MTARKTSLAGSAQNRRRVMRGTDRQNVKSRHTAGFFSLLNAVSTFVLVALMAGFRPERMATPALINVAMRTRLTGICEKVILSSAALASPSETDDKMTGIILFTKS